MKKITWKYWAFGFAIVCGCSSKVPKNADGEIVVLICVVEQFDRDALVFHGVGSLPYDTRSDVSLVRVLTPNEFRDRRIAVEFHDPKKEMDNQWLPFRTLGARIRISVGASRMPNDPRKMLPVEVIERVELISDAVP